MDKIRARRTNICQISECHMMEDDSNECQWQWFKSISDQISLYPDKEADKTIYGMFSLKLSHCLFLLHWLPFRMFTWCAARPGMKQGEKKVEFVLASYAVGIVGCQQWRHMNLMNNNDKIHIAHTECPSCRLSYEQMVAFAWNTRMHACLHRTKLVLCVRHASLSPIWLNGIHICINLFLLTLLWWWWRWRCSVFKLHLYSLIAWWDSLLLHGK